MLSVIAVVAGINFALYALDTAFRPPGGPTSSSFATGPDGLAAYAELLGRAGHPVTPLRAGLGDADLDPRNTLVVVDPETPGDDEVRALRSFVESGGRLVAGGHPPHGWLAQVTGVAPRWAPVGPNTAVPLQAAPEVEGITAVRTAGEGAWVDTGLADPVVGIPDESVVAIAAVGEGVAFLVADPSLLQNRLLDEADNAWFGLKLAGEDGRSVVFAESLHGYGTASGLAALPTRWKWALSGLAFAGLIWLLARGRRLGPPDRASRPLPPPRREYVDAVAAGLARAGAHQDAAAALVGALRAEVAGRVGDADPAGAAARLGLERDETDALLGKSSGSQAALAAGRALARLKRTI